MNKCPISIAEKFLLKKNLITENTIKEFKKKIIFEINSGFNFANKSKFPKKNELDKDIYAK